MLAKRRAVAVAATVDMPHSHVDANGYICFAGRARQPLPQPKPNQARVLCLLGASADSSLVQESQKRGKLEKCKRYASAQVVVVDDIFQKWYSASAAFINFNPTCPAPAADG